MYVYALFFQDVWDEYEEHKLHAIFSSLERAEEQAKSAKGLEWHIEKIPLDHVPETEDNIWESNLLYRTVKKGKNV